MHQHYLTAEHQNCHHRLCSTNPTTKVRKNNMKDPQAWTSIPHLLTSPIQQLLHIRPSTIHQVHPCKRSMKPSMSWQAASKHSTTMSKDWVVTRFARKHPSSHSHKTSPHCRSASKNRLHSWMASSPIKRSSIKTWRRWSKRWMIFSMCPMMEHSYGRSPVSTKRWVSVEIPAWRTESTCPMWLIHLVDAQSERQTSIYSPPFYSSPTGYKMRARLYLHGDGNARRTHMSLFFVLMRGPNDAILKFPFNQQVGFLLYDLTGQENHIIDSFRSNIRSSSSQRPRSEMNIARGISKFFSLAMIQRAGSPYVQDDTMFIKIMVDFSGLPKTMLQYALSLNPALPTHIQQLMIRQEIKRRREDAERIKASIDNAILLSNNQQPR